MKVQYTAKELAAKFGLLKPMKGAMFVDEGKTKRLERISGRNIWTVKVVGTANAGKPVGVKPTPPEPEVPPEPAPETPPTPEAPPEPLPPLPPEPAPEAPVKHKGKKHPVEDKG